MSGIRTWTQLTADNSQHHSSLKENVYFIGFMGAGKSTVARKVARRLGVPELDMDKYIVRSEGRSIKDIFDQEGEEGFRRIERKTLKELAGFPEPMLISCGGGIAVDPENRAVLKSCGKVIHLLVDADEASRRIADKTSRPLFNDMESARELCRNRLPFYEDAADVTISTGDRSVNSIAQDVIDWLESEGIVCPRLG